MYEDLKAAKNRYRRRQGRTDAVDLRQRVIDEIARAAAPFEVEVVVADSPKFLTSLARSEV